MSELPKHFKRFQEEYPRVNEAYEALGNAVHKAGPLDDKTRALVKLAISTGFGHEGAVHSHTRKALEAGISPEEIKQTILLSLPTIGLPAMQAALSWVNDILEE